MLNKEHERRIDANEKYHRKHGVRYIRVDVSEQHPDGWAKVRGNSHRTPRRVDYKVVV